MNKYNQKFSIPIISNANIFLISLVPLQLASGEPNSKSKIVEWQNIRSSSPRFCRTIQIQKVHEITDVSKKEMEYIIENQMQSLIATIVRGENKNILMKQNRDEAALMMAIPLCLFNDATSVQITKINEEIIKRFVDF